MPAKTYNVLFLCTGKLGAKHHGRGAARTLGRGRFRAYSAGSFPKGEVHLLALDLLEKAHSDTLGLRSKSWDEFAKPGAPEMDFVFTLCDQARQRGLPGLARQPGDRPLGRARPGCCRGLGSRQKPGLSLCLSGARNPDQSSLPACGSKRSIACR